MSAFCDRMKMYEEIEAGRKFIPCLPVIARMDGRGFSKLTKRMAKPFDPWFSRSMDFLTEKLVEETNACIAYTQSDEVTLIFYSPTIKSQIWFDGKIHKMTSQLAAHASVNFNLMITQYPGALYEEARGASATFDARLWQVPSLEEACNVLQWRESDAIKNSISMAACKEFSHKEMLNKSGEQLKCMLKDAGKPWEAWADRFKRGAYFARRAVGEKNPVVQLALPIFSTITNQTEVVFQSADPKTE